MFKNLGSFLVLKKENRLCYNVSKHYKNERRKSVPKGIVLSNISDLYKVEADGKIIDCNARGKFKNNEISPVAGDIVEMERIKGEVTAKEEEAKGVITKIEERKNYLKRPKMANLSQIILVLSMKLPKPDLELLDKQLVYAEYIGIKSIICLNKIDLVDEEAVERIKQVYSKIGYTVISTNAKTGEGVTELKKCLDGHITAFSGNSGVGKSTLINSLLGENTTEEGAISHKNKRGKNTTTQVCLYKIGENSYIADTPGFSTFDISEIEKEDLAYYFVEFREYLGKCEYGDCSHIKEANCAIKKAVEERKNIKRKI